MPAFLIRQLQSCRSLCVQPRQLSQEERLPLPRAPWLKYRSSEGTTSRPIRLAVAELRQLHLQPSRTSVVITVSMLPLLHVVEGARHGISHRRRNFKRHLLHHIFQCRLTATSSGFSPSFPASRVSTPSPDMAPRSCTTLRCLLTFILTMVVPTLAYPMQTKRVSRDGDLVFASLHGLLFRVRINISQHRRAPSTLCVYVLRI